MPSRQVGPPTPPADAPRHRLQPPRSPPLARLVSQGCETRPSCQCPQLTQPLPLTPRTRRRGPTAGTGDTRKNGPAATFPEGQTQKQVVGCRTTPSACVGVPWGRALRQDSRSPPSRAPDPANLPLTAFCTPSPCWPPAVHQHLQSPRSFWTPSPTPTGPQAPQHPHTSQSGWLIPSGRWRQGLQSGRGRPRLLHSEQGSQRPHGVWGWAFLFPLAAHS